MPFVLIFEQSILPLFLIVLTAFVYTRRFKPDLRVLSNVALSIFAPIFVFDSLVREDIQLARLLKPCGFMILLTAGLLLASGIAALLLRLDRDQRVSFILAGSMINIGNFGLPLIYFTFGSEAVALSVVYFVVFNLPLSTLAICLSSDKTSLKETLHDVVKIPIVHAFVLALLVNQLGLPIPSGVAKGLHLFGQGAIPLLIFILGMQLGSIQLSSGLKRFIGPILAGSVIRLAISPLLALGLLRLLAMSGLEHDVAVLQTSGPSAILPLMYAIRFNRSPELLSALIFSTTLLSGISLPILISVL